MDGDNEVMPFNQQRTYLTRNVSFSAIKVLLKRQEADIMPTRTRHLTELTQYANGWVLFHSGVVGRPETNQLPLDTSIQIL
jgi:hypothetical protein